MPGRLTIGLYNSYDPVKFHEAHRRALAMAGPIALWLECNLLTIGFPYETEARTPVEIAEWVASTTTIGHGGRYLKELKNGKIIARKCNKCGRIMIPPRMFCELCWRPTDEWVYCKDTGRINTYSICNVNWDASRIKKGEKPHLPAVIEIDGASPGMGIMHILGEVDPDDIKIGMKVKAVWKKPAEREGSITDILYFKPARR